MKKNLEVGNLKSQLIPHIVSIARTINADIIVEGVENQLQLDYMKDIGISYVQGYFFSRPIPIDEFEELIS